MYNKNAIIGNYQIISPIASGGFGHVYLAHHKVLTKRLVALKLMYVLPFSAEQDPQEFLHEAQILELLQHPSILPVVDAGVHEDIPYIVSAYASGGSLRRRLRDQNSQPFPLDTALTWLWQIGQALQYAHDRQIIHRDIKPENILFNAKDQALLADFGLATLLAASSFKQVTNAGTPRYMAPEQFQGVVSKASDQYALGCIAYELFTGHPLFEVSDALSYMYAHNHTPPRPLTDYNPELPSYIEQAVLTALRKDRNERHPDINTFLSLLKASDTSVTLERKAPGIQSLISPFSYEEQEASEWDGMTLLKVSSDQARGMQVSEADIATLPKASSDQVEEHTDRGVLFSTAGSVSHVTHESHEKEPTLFLASEPENKSEITHSFHLSEQETARKLISLPRRQRSVRLLMLIVCILILMSIVGSFFLVWQTIAARGQLQTSGNGALLPHSAATSTQLPPTPLPSSPTANPAIPSTSTPTRPVQPTPTSTPQHASTPVIRTQPTSTPALKPLHTISYYVCGDQASLTNTNHWNTVQPGSTVSTSDYSGPVNSYQGPSGDPNHSPGNCSGLYHWAWDQYPVQAMWTWTNAYLPSGSCSASIHIPSWYAGAPDAHYSLDVSSNMGSTSYTFSTQNQNQITTRWVPLLINQQVQAISLPKSTNSIYTLTLTLTNGGTPNWYLGAEAIRFDCDYRA